MGELFRGVNQEMDRAINGRIMPRGSKPEIFLRYDGKAKFDGSFTHGPSVKNTARAHQIQTGLYEGRGVSTSRSQQCAIWFATSGNTVAGVVYVLDEDRLEEVGILCLDFGKDSLHPEHQEVTLVNPHRDGEIPASVVVRKLSVRADGAIE